MILRDYQSEAVDAIFNCWDKGVNKDLLISSPTGSGKSVIIAELIRRLVEGWPEIRIIVITDSRELIVQNKNALNLHAKKISTGVFSAGLGKRQSGGASVIFCGIQTVYNKAFQFEKIDVILIDECHMISRKAQSRYFKFFKDMALANPNVCRVGFSATIWRTDSGLLHEGDDAMFQEIAYACDMKQLIKEGWLVPLISKSGVSKIDLKNVHIKGNEYDQSELACAADDETLIRLAVAEIVECGKDRKSWLVFTSSVLHSQHTAAEFLKHGIDCEIVTGETPKEKRDDILSRFKSGKIRCLINVSVLIKGFDSPRIDLLALMTSTCSSGKFVQACGRGMRPFVDEDGIKKDNCILLDFGTNVARLGMIDDIDPVQTKNIFNRVKTPPPTKECPSCHALFHARVMLCPACGYNFDVDRENEVGINHGPEAYSGPVLTSQQQPFIVDVKDFWVSRHKKHGKPDSLKVSFFDSMDKEFSMWLSLDSASAYAAEKSRAIIKQFGGKAATVDDALKEHFNWRKVERIRVKPEGRFFRIDGFVFKKGEAMQQSLINGDVT
ncbi:MAG: DEAD/DEAH box helicase [Candidatus Paceibacterota bacterium]|jgi:DNA repair protein RadD